MSEKDYIRVGNQTRIGIMLEIIKGVLSDNDIIQDIELEQMQRTLARWQMFLLESSVEEAEEA